MKKPTLTITSLGERLRLCRQTLGYTQQQVAKEMGINQSVISKIESGAVVYSNILFSLLLFYAKYVDLNALFADEFDMTEQQILFSQKEAMLSLTIEKIDMLKQDVIQQLDSIKSYIKD